MSARILMFLLAGWSAALVSGRVAGQEGKRPGVNKMTIIQAETLFPVVGPPIKDGFVIVRGKKITGVGLPRQMPPNLPVTKVKVATPGFIDAHSHALDGLLDPERREAQALLHQGVTTVVLNPDGGGPHDLAAVGAEGPRPQVNAAG